MSEPTSEEVLVRGGFLEELLRVREDRRVKGGGERGGWEQRQTSRLRESRLTGKTYLMVCASVSCVISVLCVSCPLCVICVSCVSCPLCVWYGC